MFSLLAHLSCLFLLLNPIFGALTNCSDVDCGISREDRDNRLFSIASRPLLGYNFYDGFDWCFNQTDVLFAVDYVASNLKPLGYTLIMIEYYWYLDLNSETMYLDQWGRPQPDPNRFSSSIGEQGFRQLGAYIHSKGLLFGLHTMRGVSHMAVKQKLSIFNTNYTAEDIVDLTQPCPWVGGGTTSPYARFYSVNMSQPAAQQFYNSLYAQYAEWGVDVIKNDCVWSNYVPDQIAAASKAIDASNRPMLYSLSPGMDDPTLTKHVLPMVNWWRITTDTWDDWSRIVNHFGSIARQQSFIGTIGRYGQPSFPDLDILPLGYIGDEGQCHPPSRFSKLTQDEQVTVMSLWVIVRSPLQYAGDLRHIDPFSMALITNTQALKINANSTNNDFLISNSSMAVWRADSIDWRNDGVSYVSIHNLLDTTVLISIKIQAVRGVQKGDHCEIFDVWNQSTDSKILLPSDIISVTLQKHASALFTIFNCSSSSLPASTN